MVSKLLLWKKIILSSYSFCIYVLFMFYECYAFLIFEVYMGEYITVSA